MTRSSLLSVIAESNIRFEERPFSVAEAKAAREAFITGAGALILPVVSIDGEPVGDGKAGEVVVTPFHVSAMPLVRYRTGDICTWHKAPLRGEGLGAHLGPVLGRMQQHGPAHVMSRVREIEDADPTGDGGRHPLA